MTWALHEGDCLDPVTGLASLPDRSIDVVLTDPPYSEHVHSKIRSGRDGGSKGIGGVAVPLDFAHITEAEMEAASVQFARLVRRWVIVFSDIESCHLWRIRLQDAGLEYVRTGIWHKSVHTPQFTGDRPAPGCEAFTICHPKGRKRWNGGGRSGVYRFASEGQGARGTGRFHESQKPLALMDALVRDFTDPGETILDPYAGSGTTGAAALRLGRRFVGWERDATYHAKASARLAGAREQTSLFAAKQPKPKQTTLMDDGSIK